MIDGLLYVKAWLVSEETESSGAEPRPQELKRGVIVLASNRVRLWKGMEGLHPFVFLGDCCARTDWCEGRHDDFYPRHCVEHAYLKVAVTTIALLSCHQVDNQMQICLTIEIIYWFPVTSRVILFLLYSSKFQRKP